MSGSSAASSSSSLQGPNGGLDCGSAKGAGNQLLCLFRDPFAQTFKSTAIWTALGTSFAFTLLIIAAFSLIRPRNSVVYAPKLKYADKKHAPPTIGKGLMDWTPPLAKLHEDQLIDKIGLDATLFLRFTKMLRNLFAVIAIVALGLIMPVNIISGLRSSEAKSFNNQGFWTITTPQYTKGAGLWAHVIAVWAINFIVAFFLWRNTIAVTRLRRNYFDSAEYLHSLHSRTLMFTDLPLAARTDEGILRMADQIEQTAGIPRASVGRNVKELPELIEQHEKAVRELESVLAKYLKNPDKLPAKRPTMRQGGNRVDAIDYLTSRIADLETQVVHVRESIDKRNPMPYGFASFERIDEAHTVAFAAKKKHPQGSTIRLAPTPKDIIWKNLPLSKKDRSWKRFINNFWILVLTFVWIAPNALIAIFLSNLTNLANVWPGFKHTYEDDPKWWAVVQGIASPALTSLVYILLPIAFRRLSTHAGDITKTSRERHVATKLYAFFVFNNLIVFSIFSAIWAFVAAVVSNSKDRNESVWQSIRDGYFFTTMQTGLLEVTPFWLTWLVQRNLGSAADLAQMIQLFWVWFVKTFTSPTPRQQIELTAPLAFDYAVYYNYFLFYATVGLFFTTLQPLVVPIAALYFAVDYWLKKYLLLYVFITKTESGGQFWRVLFNRIIFAVILADFVYALMIKSAGYWSMVAALAPLPLLQMALKFYCARTFDDQAQFYTKAALHDPESMDESGQKARRVDKVSKKFGHPVLHSTLMTPMVHAKAQRLMSSIYGHRVGSATNATTVPNGLTDTSIAMDAMSQVRPGKALLFEDHQVKRKELFEVVPENKLDFSYFKNREDFANENGGDGELYGRPADLISERSATPHSFFRGERGYSNGTGTSPSSSRASSPDPMAGTPPLHSRVSSPAHIRELQRMPQAASSARDGSPRGTGTSVGVGRGFYRNDSATESEINLLRAAQPVGYAAVESDDNYQSRSAGQRSSSGDVNYRNISNPLSEPAFAAGRNHSPGPAQREVYGLDRWRTPLGVGATGYHGVPDSDADHTDITYDAYRGRRS